MAHSLLFTPAPLLTMQKSILLSIAAFFVLSFAVAIAQEDDATTTRAADERFVIETKEKATPALKGLKLEKEYKPRLPNGFGPTGINVDAAQRERIYKILTDYNELIALLKLRIELLEKERDAKILEVPTPAQLQKARPTRGLLAR